MKIPIKPSLNSKLVIMLGFENTETFLLKDIRKIGQKKVLSLVNLKLQVPWTYVISDFHGEPIIGGFYEK